jgi:hypothetical protein
LKLRKFTVNEQQHINWEYHGFPKSVWKIGIYYIV